MNKILPIFDPKSIQHNAEVPEVTLVPLDLSRLPKKVCVRVRRTNGNVEIRHVGKQIRLKMMTDYDLPSNDDYDKLCDIADAALLGARRVLDPKWTGQPVYSTGNGTIEIRIHDLVSGGEALAALDRAVEVLLKQADALLKATAQGIRLQCPGDDDWGRA